MEENKDKKNTSNVSDNTIVYKIQNPKKGRKKKKDKTKRKQIIKRILIVLAVIAVIAVGVVGGIIYGLMKEAKLEMEDLAIKYENTIVKDINGETIAVLSGTENREIISITEMPDYLPKAFIAIEDERFYDHSGVDIKRTGAATVTYLLHGGSSSFGGSTITQQLVKNLTQEKEKTWKRKVKEMARAFEIEKQLSKDQILELYLNLIFLGDQVYGVEIASNYYFSKSASELDLAECAFLAGINNAPNMYNPFSDDEDSKALIKKRTIIVLNKMKELGKIENEQEYNEAIAKVEEGIEFTKGSIVQNVYSYHTDAAILQIINDLMEKNDWTYEYAELYLKNGGFTIYTTQNTEIQNKMEEVSKQSKYMIASKKNEGKTSQAGMVLIDHKTGYVLGVIGGLGEKTSMGWNRATQTVKQTGSAMKTLAVLAPGIENGIITAATGFDDVPTSFGTYNPHNSGYVYKGLLTTRYAIESSQNIPMVKALQIIGPEKSIEFLKTAGITTLDDKKDNGLGLALGGLTNGISPLEVGVAYAAIANDGVYIEPTFYTKVVDSNGETILEAKQETRTIMSSAAAYVVKEILTQPVKGGTASFCSISGMSVAAKTGTTNDNYDRWLCGFTPYYTAATWFGYDENETVRFSGNNPAGLIWIDVMRAAHKGLEGKTFASTRPDGVVTATVCRDSGLLVTEACKNDPRGNRAYTEYFVKGTVPTKQCDCHVEVEICTDTGLLANEHCPNKETKVFITRPNSDTNKAWEKAKDAEYMLTITETCTEHSQTKDTEKPKIKLKGDSSITLKLNEKYKEEGATATDDKDGDLTSSIEISGTVDTSREGTYKVTYKVKDSSGNEAVAERTIRVEDSKPKITLNGDSTITLKLNEEYKEAGATATDEIDGDLTSKINKTGEVDTTKEGEYIITYTVKNFRNKEAKVERKIIVKATEEEKPADDNTVED